MSLSVVPSGNGLALETKGLNGNHRLAANRQLMGKEQKGRIELLGIVGKVGYVAFDSRRSLGIDLFFLRSRKMS